MGAARTFFEWLLNFVRGVSLLVTTVFAPSLGFGHGKNRHYYQRVEPLEPLGAHGDGKVGQDVTSENTTSGSLRVESPRETPAPSTRSSIEPATEPSTEPATEPFAETSDLEPQRKQSSLVVRLTSENTHLLEQLTKSEREAKAWRQVMKLVLDFVEIAMASSRIDDRTARLDLLDALDNIEARAISTGFDSSDLVQRLNKMVGKHC